MAIVTDTSLSQRLAELKEKNPHAYPRDYAAQLCISEAELTPTYYPGRTQELPSLEAVFESLAKLKRVKLMARTAFAVFELFTKVDFKREEGALVLQSPLCFTALDAAKLGPVFLLSPASEKEKAAILIFDKAGAAALKLYIEVSEFDPALFTATGGGEKKSADLAALAAKVKASLVSGTSAAYVPDATAPRQLIEGSAGNSAVAFELLTDAIAVVMLHKPVKVVDARGWFNILDHDFNLHLKEEAISRLAGEEYGAVKSIRTESAAGEWIKIYGPLSSNVTL